MISDSALQECSKSVSKRFRHLTKSIFCNPVIIFRAVPSIIANEFVHKVNNIKKIDCSWVE